MLRVFGIEMSCSQIFLHLLHDTTIVVMKSSVSLFFSN